jgi:hypothetical protein
MGSIVRPHRLADAICGALATVVVCAAIIILWAMTGQR